MTRRPLFLRWVVRQSVVVTMLLAAGIAYAHRLHGASLAMVPLILLVLAGSCAYSGLLHWRADNWLPSRAAIWGYATSTNAPPARRPGGLRHLWFTAGVCQLLGLLGTVAGFYAMFNDGSGSRPGGPGASGDLAARVTHGAGVALSATFVGILASIVILLEHHLLDRSP